MNEYKMMVILNNGARFERVKRCFPHQIKEALEDFCWDCFYEEPEGATATEIVKATYKAVARG